jgi:hypothetical protein
MENFKKSVEEINLSIERTKTVSAVFIEGTVGMMRGLSSLGMALSSFKGAWTTLTDPDMSGFEKIVSIMTSLGMAIPSLVSSIDLFKNSWGGVVEGLKKAVSATAEAVVLQGI